MTNPTTEQLPAYSNQPNFVGYPLFYIIDGETAMCACFIDFCSKQNKHIIKKFISIFRPIYSYVKEWCFFFEYQMLITH